MLKDRIININSSSCSHVCFFLLCTPQSKVVTLRQTHTDFLVSAENTSNITFLHSLPFRTAMLPFYLFTVYCLSNELNRRQFTHTKKSRPAWELLPVHLKQHQPDFHFTLMTTQAYVPNPAIDKQWPLLFLPANC